MTRMRSTTALTVAAVLLAPYALRADVKEEEKTRVQLAGVLGGVMNMFGGRAAREGVTESVAVKGDRKATLREDTGQIVDLSEEKVYDLDLKKKTYKVTTFAELRRRMEEQQRRAAESAQREEKDKSAKEKPAERDPNAKEVEIDFDIKSTGQKKTINGFDTSEQVMTITVREKGKTLQEGGGMVLTSDMWMAPAIPAMKEVADFEMRYAQKLYGGLAGVSPEQMAQALAMYPMLKPALGRMTTEGAKLQGTAIQTTTTMDAVKSAEQMQEEAKSSSSTSSSDSDSSKPQGVSGAIGGLLARRMKRNADENKDNASASGDKSRATFMTTTHEVLKVTTDVSAADVAVPAGFKENR